MSEFSNRRPAGFRQEIWMAAAVALAALFLFGPAVSYDFVRLDDYVYVVENADVTGGLTWAGVKAAFGQMQLCLWIPLLNLSYMLDVEAFGPGPGGFHFTNVLLHALNAALFFLLLRRWTGRHWMACWGALFWACHPLRVESVAWISGRKDVLSGLFFLLCLWAYGRSADGRKGARGWFWAAAGFFALGLMGKATLMAAPFLLLLLDIWPLRRARPGEPRWFARMVRLAAEKWAFWLLSVLAGALGIWGHAAQNALRPADLGTRLWRIPVHAACYLGQTVWPRSLHVLYADLPLAAGMVAGAILLVAGISAGAWWVRRRRPGVGVGWLWYLAMLLPVAGVVGFGAQSRADRYTYLPAMGLVLMAVQGLPTHGKRRRAWIAAGIASVAAAGVLTARQLPVWRHSGALMERVLKCDSGHFLAHMGRGIWLWEQGDRAAAAEYFRRIWAYPDPAHAEAMAAVANEMVLRGNAALAQEMLRPALYGSAATPEIHGVYGTAYLHAGELDDAIRHLNRAVEMDPSALRYRKELLRALFENGETEKARAQAVRVKEQGGGDIQTAKDLFPFYARCWNEGGKAYAWGYFRRLAERETGDAALLNNVAWLAATARPAPRESGPIALAFAERAARLTKRKDAQILDTLAAAQAGIGDFRGAAETGRAALALAERNGLVDLGEEIKARIRTYETGRPWRP